MTWTGILILVFFSGCVAAGGVQNQDADSPVFPVESLFLTPDDDMEIRIQKFMALHPFPTEADKITYLLNGIRDSGCVFIRNGSEYPSGIAANWLRRKKGTREFRETPLVSAWDFIFRVASRSRHSGKSYQVVLEDGTCTPTQPVLHNELTALEKALALKEQNKVLLDPLPEEAREPRLTASLSEGVVQDAFTAAENVSAPAGERAANPEEPGEEAPLSGVTEVAIPVE